MFRLSGRNLIVSESSLKNKIFPQVHSLVIHDARDIHPFTCVFPNVKRLFFYQCDKNTHYYWALHQRNFPNCVKLEVDGHPCQASFVYRCLDAVRKNNLELTISSQFLSNWLRYGGKTDGLPDLLCTPRVLVKSNKDFEELFTAFTQDLDLHSAQHL